jgi:hypothetical protein
MSQTPSFRLRSFRLHLRRRRRVSSAFALIAATATAAAASVVPVTASSAVSGDACPAAFPVDQVVANQTVSGTTVTQGTAPTTFTGTVLGVIEDGIAPGLDMVLARLSSPEIDRVGGIWYGMSGSPVYAADGRLIGAVAYGLAWGSSPVAGITPYAEMQKMLQSPATTTRSADTAEEVAIPRAMARTLATSGAAAEDEVAGGLRRLPIPLGVSGLRQGRLDGFAKKVGLSDVRVYAAGAAKPSSEKIPVEEGGNLAASVSYGDLSAIGVGTATAVCGDKVLGFGHPMLYSGESSMALHGARAVYVHEESLGAPFKVANPGAPVGAVLQDRLGGLLTVQDATRIPKATRVTSDVSVIGEGEREGTTFINVPDAVPSLASFAVLVNQDRVFDAFAAGSATLGWTVRGTREDGSPWELRRRDVYASKWDISFETLWDLWSQLESIHFNDIEDVTIDSIDTTSTMSRVFKAYRISRVQIRGGGRWNELRTDAPLLVRGGQTKRFRVTLTSAELGTRHVRIALEIPQRTGRKFGFLEIVGGNSSFSDEGMFMEDGMGMGETSPAESFDGLLRRLRNAPSNDLVMANLTLFRLNGTTIRRSPRKATGTVVNGGVMVEVQGIG